MDISLGESAKDILTEISKKGWCDMTWLNVYRTRLFLIGFVVAILFGGGSAKAEFVWTQKADMSTPRRNFATSVVNGKIYALGGENREGVWWVVNSNMEEYDPISNTWTKKPDMPVQMSDLGC